MNTGGIIHTHTLNAYAVKGGGFRGVVFEIDTKQRDASELLPTLDAAKFWAKSRIHQSLGGVNYSLAPLRRKGEYIANVWRMVAA